MRSKTSIGAGGVVEAVLAGLQHAAAIGQARQQKIPAACARRRPRPAFGDAAGGGAARDFDEDLALETLIRRESTR